MQFEEATYLKIRLRSRQKVKQPWMRVKPILTSGCRQADHLYRVSSQDLSGSEYRALMSVPVESYELTLYDRFSSPFFGPLPILHTFDE